MLLSVVVPVYGAPQTVRPLYKRLISALSWADDLEIILVNDACPKNSGAEIEKLAKEDSRVKYINLARNFGQHIAISAGLDYAGGDYVAVMDCDLQDRPEEIKKLYDKAQEGFDAVFAYRLNRQDSWAKRFTSKCFHDVYNFFSEKSTKSPVLHGNFSVITRRVVEKYRQFTEKNRGYPNIIMWLGYKMGYVEVEHDARAEGKSSYNLFKSLYLAFSIIMSQSNKPLQLSMFCSAGMFILSFLLILRLVYIRLFYGSPLEGWTSIMVSLFFVSGLLFLCLSVIGAYIGNIFNESKRRPLYIVDKVMNVKETR